jgi:RNA polymerase sigma-70 factor (ECF subfamily)
VWRRPEKPGEAVTVRRRARLSLGVTITEPAAAHDSSEAMIGEVWASRLRQALVARYGWEQGHEACQDALAYAWEHADRLRAMDNPVGYLYRVGQTSVRRQQRWSRHVDLPPVIPSALPDVEPGLPAALAALSDRQRLAVLLVHAHGWTHEEAATVLGIDVSTLRNHLQRGLRRLRTTLGVDDAEPE